MKTYWGYKHINGGIAVKKAFGHYVKDAIQDARQSPFVEKVVPVFQAKDRETAAEYIKKQVNE